MNIINKLACTLARSILACFCFVFSAHATSITLPYSFVAGSPISASQMMGNFATITSAISSTVSSPWVLSSSNVYYNAGAVGIGSSAPARALDVNGSVSVSGSLAVNGAVSATTLNSCSGSITLTGVYQNICALADMQTGMLVLNGNLGGNFAVYLITTNASAGEDVPNLVEAKV